MYIRSKKRMFRICNFYPGFEKLDSNIKFNPNGKKMKKLLQQGK